jgi:HAE1 family hydrophobic/amphiphilic exporter-1
VGFPKTVALGEIATVELGEQLTTVSRLDGKVAATATAKITSQNVGAVSRAIQSEIDSLDFPGGVEIGMGGITEDMRQSFSAMFVAIGIALPLAYAVLVITFRSLRGPLIIMVSLPLASIGALLALFLTGRPLGISGLMGILMLVGIVLTNAVVLIAVVEQMRRDGRHAHDALVEGGRTRLRPILMTALTTMIAMLPLAFGLGEGVLMAAELATVVIGGLFSSTVLTLLVVPTVYAVVNRVRPAAAGED